jgi:hypothetical protein
MSNGRKRKRREEERGGGGGEREVRLNLPFIVVVNIVDSCYF